MSDMLPFLRMDRRCFAWVRKSYLQALYVKQGRLSLNSTVTAIRVMDALIRYYRAAETAEEKHHRCEFFWISIPEVETAISHAIKHYRAIQAVGGESAHEARIGALNAAYRKQRDYADLQRERQRDLVHSRAKKA